MSRAGVVVISLALTVALMLSLAGCTTSSQGVQAKTAKLAMLQRGLSTADDVRRELGEPRGKGAVRLSVGSAITWFYDDDETNFNQVVSDMRRVRYLMIFMKGEAYDGYLWVDAESTWKERP